MFFAIENYSQKLKLRQWFFAFSCYGFSLYASLMYWLFELTPVLQEQLSTAASCGLILLAIVASAFFLGIFYALGLTLLCRVAKNINLDAIFFAFFYILGEFFTQCFTPLSFPWARLAVIVTPFTEFIQSANLLGSLFVSFIVALINAFLCRAIIQRKTFKKCAVALCTAVAVFSANTIYGTLRLKYNKVDKAENSSNAVIVQGNFSGLDKWQMSTEEVINAYFDEALKLIDENTKLVVFPETAAPFRYNKVPYYADMLEQFATENDITLVTGAFYEEQHDDLTDIYNALLCIEPYNTVSEPYYKQVLVPIGEYVPFADVLMQHYPELFEIIGYVKQGDENGAIDTSEATIGGVICYESIYPSIVRSTVNEGAEIITIISNDSWFGKSPALRQHHAHAILRAVENDRFVLRASSTAVTSAIDNRGNVIKTAPMLEKCAIKVDYSLNSDKTLYAYAGDIILLPSALLALYSLYRVIKRRIDFNNDNTEKT